VEEREGDAREIMRWFSPVSPCKNPSIKIGYISFLTSLLNIL
jgi:hypothetical protein